MIKKMPRHNRVVGEEENGKSEGGGFVVIKHRIDFDIAHLDWSPMPEGTVAFWLFETEAGLVGSVSVGKFSDVTADVVKWGLTGCLIHSKLGEPVRKAFKATFDPLINEWFQKHPIRPLATSSPLEEQMQAKKRDWHKELQELDPRIRQRRGHTDSI